MQYSKYILDKHGGQQDELDRLQDKNKGCRTCIQAAGRAYRLQDKQDSLWDDQVRLQDEQDRLNDKQVRLQNKQ